MAGANRKRFEPCCYLWEPTWEQKYFVTSVAGIGTCLICGFAFATNEKSKVQRHFLICHSDEYEQKFPLESDVRRHEIDRLKSALHETAQQSNRYEEKFQPFTAVQIVRKSSFEVAQILAETLKPFDDEEAARNAIIVSAQKLLSDAEEVKNHLLAKMRELPSSRDSITKKVGVISENIHNRLRADMQKCEWYSLRLFESTGVTDEARFRVSIRLVFEDFSTREESLLCISLKRPATGTNLYTVLKDQLVKTKVPLNKLVSINTGGTRAMLGDQSWHKVLFALCKQDSDFPTFVNLHCAYNRAALYAKLFASNPAMDRVKENLIPIRAKLVKYRSLRLLLEEVHNGLLDLYYCMEVDWLKGGKILEKLHDVLMQIREVFKSGNEVVEELENHTCLIDLSFFAGLVKCVDEWISRVREKSKTVFIFVDQLFEFRDQIDTWISHCRSNTVIEEFERFSKTVRRLVGKDYFRGERFAVYLEELKDVLDTKSTYTEFEKIRIITNYFQGPFTVENISEVAESMVDLFPDMRIQELRDSMNTLKYNSDVRGLIMHSCGSDTNNFWTDVNQEKYKSLVTVYKRLVSCFY